MPCTRLILTAGISAFTSRNFLGARFREPGSPLVFPPGRQNPEPATPGMAEAELTALCRDWAARGAFHDAEDASRISAEYSMLRAIATHGKGIAPGALVHLVHTPTLAGRLAVHLQIPVLEETFRIQCHAEELAVPFDPAQPGGLALASGAFIGQISALLKDGDPRGTAFAPIGGYKSMVALGHIAASFHGYPSLYIHEDSQILQEISPAPVAVTPQARTTLGPLARRIGNGAEWHALIPAERALAAEHPAFFTRVEDLVCLNELGHYLRLGSLPVLLDPGAETERRANPAMVNGQIRQLSILAATQPDHHSINHSLITAPGRHQTWRLARMGGGIRIAWQLRPDALLVGKIWRDHAVYDKEAATWVQRPLPADSSSFMAFE